MHTKKAVALGRFSLATALHLTPARLNRLNDVAPMPQIRFCTFGPVVRPESYSLRCGGIVQDASGIKLLAEERAQILIPFLPAFKVLSSGKEVALAPVAGSMSKDEVMAEVYRITRPRNEMIDLPRLSQPPITIETAIGLDVPQ